MFAPTTLPDSHNATSSPASACGATPCARGGGQIAALYGLAPAPANHSAWLAWVVGSTTSGTFGPSGSTSSSSAALRSSLVSRLKQRLGTDGSTLFNLTWKESTTPSQRSVSRLVASVPRTSGSGCGSWPTPTKTQAGGTPEQFMERKRRSFGARNPRVTDLALAVRHFYAEAMGWDGKSLNPAFPCWLMGLPPCWHKTAPTETPSTLRRRKSS